MMVLIKIGDNSYNGCLFAMELTEATQLLEMLRGKGVTYDSDNVYKYYDVKTTITSEDFTLKKRAIPIPMPPQIEDSINDI